MLKTTEQRSWTGCGVPHLAHIACLGLMDSNNLEKCWCTVRFGSLDLGLCLTEIRNGLCADLVLSTRKIVALLALFYRLVHVG